MAIPTDEIRRYVQELKLFYREALVSGGIFFVCVVAWLATSGGGFWPLWVLIALAAHLIFRAVSLGILSKNNVFKKFTVFLSPQWEEKQIEKYVKLYQERHDKDPYEEEFSEKNSDQNETSDKKSAAIGAPL